MLGLSACGTGPNEPDPPVVKIFSQEGIIAEHSSFRNKDGNGMHETVYKDSSFAAELGEVTVFKPEVKDAVAEYLLSHLKEVKTLRPIGVTHLYQLANGHSLYYVRYAQNGKAETHWGCVLSRKEGRYRLYKQHLSAVRDREFAGVYAMKDSLILKAFSRD